MFPDEVNAALLGFLTREALNAASGHAAPAG